MELRKLKAESIAQQGRLKDFHVIHQEMKKGLELEKDAAKTDFDSLQAVNLLRIAELEGQLNPAEESGGNKRNRRR